MVLELPDWLTLELILRILDNKAFSAIYWLAAAIVAIVGFVARMKYRDRNLRRLLDAYLEKARKAEGKERESVKKIIGRAIKKARGSPAQGSFNPADVFEEAARLCAQRQPRAALDLLKNEAGHCEATIEYSRHQVRLAQERAATAYLEMGSILREQDRGLEALEAFRAMLRVNPGDLDGLRMLGVQYRDLRRYGEAEQNFTALAHIVANDPTAFAEAKRELAATFLGNRDFTRAEAVLNEAIAIERSREDQRGIALTLESLGTVRTAQSRWRQAKAAYMDSKTIFEALGDKESVARLEQLLRQLETGRDEELRRRRNGPRETGGDGATLQ